MRPLRVVEIHVIVDEDDVQQLDQTAQTGNPLLSEMGGTVEIELDRVQGADENLRNHGRLVPRGRQPLLNGHAGDNPRMDVEPHVEGIQRFVDPFLDRIQPLLVRDEEQDALTAPQRGVNGAGHQRRRPPTPRIAFDQQVGTGMTFRSSIRRRGALIDHFLVRLAEPLEELQLIGRGSRAAKQGLQFGSVAESGPCRTLQPLRSADAATSLGELPEQLVQPAGPHVLPC